MHAVIELEAPRPEAAPSLSAEFVGQIATAVRLGKLSDEAAREALWSYAMACHPGARAASERGWAALLSEYRRRREWQDACD